jgi:hypothetical protein
MAKNMKGKWQRCQAHYIYPSLKTVATCRRRGSYDYRCKSWQGDKKHRVLLLCIGHKMWILDEINNQDGFVPIWLGMPRSQGILINKEISK